MKRALLYSVLLGSLIAIMGCGPPWQVVRQTVPNPLLGKRQFAVMPIDFNSLRVGGKTEAEYLAEKDADSRQSWVGDKVAMNETFQKGLMNEAKDYGIQVASGGQAEFLIQPRVDFVEPGFYTYVVNRASETRMTVLVTAANGTVLDEITMVHGTAADVINAASGSRLRADAEALGGFTAKYLQSRSAPAEE